MRMILEEEKRKNFKYDMVYKTRPDLALMAPVDLTMLDNTLRARNLDIMFNKCLKSYVGDDHIAFGRVGVMKLFSSRKYLDNIAVRPGTTNPEEMQRSSFDWLRVRYDYVHDMMKYFLVRTIDASPVYLGGVLNESEINHYHHGKWMTQCLPPSHSWNPISIPPEDLESVCQETERLRDHVDSVDFVHRLHDQMSYRRSCLGTGS